MPRHIALPRIQVYPLPALVSESLLQGTTAVVIDVLRATTVYTFATHAGVKEIIPTLDIETALQLKQHYPPGQVLLGGERQGLPIEGFDLGNSPQYYTSEKVLGKTLILTTTNGTAAMHAARSAKRIFIASFLNAKAIVERLREEQNIAIICAGTNGQETEEDLLLAGCLTCRLTNKRRFRVNESATHVAGLWHEPISASALENQLRESIGGRNLRRIGLDADIAASAQIDSLDIVPQLITGSEHF